MYLGGGKGGGGEAAFAWGIAIGRCDLEYEFVKDRLKERPEP